MNIQYIVKFLSEMCCITSRREKRCSDCIFAPSFDIEVTFRIFKINNIINFCLKYLISKR